MNAMTIDGGDQVNAIVTLLLIPVGLTDNRVWHWQPIPSESRVGTFTDSLRSVVALTALIAIRFQMSILYFHAAIGKLAVEEWVNGTALYYYCLTNPTFGLPHWLTVMSPLLTSRWVVVPTWSVLLLETGLFMALVMPKAVWKYWLVAGILFHTVIAVMLGLVSFSLAVIAALILYLRPTECAFSFCWVTNLFQKKSLIFQRQLSDAELSKM